MFIDRDSRLAGEATNAFTSRVEPEKPWVLLVRPGFALQVCIPGVLGCMGDAQLERVAIVAGEPLLKVRLLFLSVSQMSKPQALKVGTEKEMRALHNAVQFFACTCMFRIEVVQSR